MCVYFCVCVCERAHVRVCVGVCVCVCFGVIDENTKTNQLIEISENVILIIINIIIRRYILYEHGTCLMI